MKTRSIQLLATVMVISIVPPASFADEISGIDKVLHFDQPQTPLKSLDFKHDDELEPVLNDFRIIEVSYLSNNIGERWAIVTFENKSSGQRLLKNEVIVATFADGSQTNSLNLHKILKGNEHLTKSVFFGIHRFPIVNVRVE